MYLTGNQFMDLSEFYKRSLSYSEYHACDLQHENTRVCPVHAVNCRFKILSCKKCFKKKEGERSTCITVKNVLCDEYVLSQFLVIVIIFFL